MQQAINRYIFNSLKVQKLFNSIIRVDWEESTKIKSDNPLENDVIEQQRKIYLLVYSCIVVCGIFVFTWRAFSIHLMLLRISTNLHDMLFRGVVHAKMLFFNNNPSGRILNRFARDIYNVDSFLPDSMFEVSDVSKIIGVS